MVGSAVSVKKLWKSLRTSFTAKGRVIKQKLKKTRFRNGSPHRSDRRFDHYNYSDDEEIDSRMKKKIRSLKVKAMGCIVGRAEIEPGKGQFVYVTDLYRSKPPPATDFSEEDAGKAKAAAKDGASGSNSPADAEMPDIETRKSTNSVDVKLKAVEASPSTAPAASPSKQRKSVCWNYLEKSEKVDVDAESFISNFYQEMKLERQKSVAEYREMLERGTS